MQSELNAAAKRNEPVLVFTTDPHAGGVSLGRACEIERGEGPPPTAAERGALAKLQAVARKIVDPETVEQWAVVKPMYEAAPPHLKKRLGRLTIKEAADALTFSPALKGSVARPGRVQVAARSPRTRSVRASRATARAPGSRTDDDPH